MTPEIFSPCFNIPKATSKTIAIRLNPIFTFFNSTYCPPLSLDEDEVCGDNPDPPEVLNGMMAMVVVMIAMMMMMIKTTIMVLMMVVVVTKVP